jgi:DNA-binding beta-propeller fold protein YncE
LVLSLSTSGKENWRYIDQSLGNQSAYGITSDTDGNVYVAGESRGSWRILSLTPKGELRWASDGRPGAAQAIAFDKEGNLVVAGSGKGGWRVVKLKAAGEIVWERETRAPSHSAAMAVAVDPADNILVAGRWRDRNDTLRIEKLNPNGDSLWAYADEAGGMIGRGITVDSAGNAIIVGESDTDWVILSLDANANLLWRFTHEGGGGRINRDQAFSVAHHPDGGFVVTGLVHPLPPEFPSLGLVDWRIARYQVEAGE